MSDKRNAQMYVSRLTYKTFRGLSDNYKKRVPHKGHFYSCSKEYTWAFGSRLSSEILEHFMNLDFARYPEMLPLLNGCQPWLAEPGQPVKFKQRVHENKEIIEGKHDPKLYLDPQTMTDFTKYLEEDLPLSSKLLYKGLGD